MGLSIDREVKEDEREKEEEEEGYGRGGEKLEEEGEEEYEVFNSCYLAVLVWSQEFYPIGLYGLHYYFV